MNLSSWRIVIPWTNCGLGSWNTNPAGLYTPIQDILFVLEKEKKKR
jgi:hypothetical protein